jgi:hypothetical protein
LIEDDRGAILVRRCSNHGRVEATEIRVVVIQPASHSRTLPYRSAAHAFGMLGALQNALTGVPSGSVATKHGLVASHVST